MTARILDGRAAADSLLEGLKAEVQKFNPLLVVVQVGDDPASASYIKQKIKSCESIGMRQEHHKLPASTTKDQLLAVVDQLNADKNVTGFFVQFPLPKQLEELRSEIIARIDPRKDIDGFGPHSISSLLQGKEDDALLPATPSGIVALLELEKIDVSGKHAVIVGRSTIVGKPLSLMLLNRNATVTVCHSKTKDLAAMTRQADILIVAVGKSNLITADMVKPGAVVIDVGMNRDDGKLKGDIDFDAVSEVASAITPVPGGVGPMTVACLLRNCVRAAQQK